MTRQRVSALGRLRRWLEATAHPLRRRLARSRVQKKSPAGHVLFLCHGNICRSPLAEVLFRRETGRAFAGAIDATSAGFIGPDRRSPAEALAAAARLGLDLSRHRSKLVTDELVRGSALVVVMSGQQAHAIRSRFGRSSPNVLVLGDLDPDPIVARTILDPWNGAADVFDESYARIDRCTRMLVQLMTSSP